ncbi:MAG: hypothetical protein HEEMFOPI_01517 [Holosporales bacterium]
MQTYKLIKDSPVLINQLELMKEFRGKSSQFISQVNYWIKNGQGLLKNNKRWIYNTAKEWAEQLGVSDRQIERIIQKLKQQGVIQVEHFSKTNRVNYITLNYEKLDEILKNRLDISSESDRQNIGIYNKKTKITNKEINKSEERAGALQILQSADQTNSSKQIEQVKKNDLKIEKIDDKTIESNLCEQSKKAFNSSLEQQNKPLKRNTAKEMVDLWNQFFPKSHATLNKDLSKNLVAAFKLKFKFDMEQWKHYLKRIESSSYLTGESFQLSLYWALKFLTIDRIGKGDFGVKEIIVAPKTEDLKSNVETHIASLNESDRLKDVRLKIATVIGYQSYLSWFTQVSFFENENGIHFKANSTFAQDYIMAHFGHLFKTQCHESCFRMIHFVKSS